jgi:hypothetical protein
MRDWWAGLWKDTWLGVAVLVGLMSGIASILREWLAIFHPSIASAGPVFRASLWTCFVISCGVVVARQRSAIVQHERREHKSSETEMESRRLHDLFGGFMREGEALADELRRGVQHYGIWLKKRSDGY